ncbi:MAG: hypothetical protein QT08_C0022G0021 [archaeon GW2011_AR17]|nr:MAG: hypothetical protein QT08_C0022G0021 [archaeon GW2011_AR17]MBS3154558.1 hypothetical protein [Candidatus Woesearchaeota archaeon]HIH15515.1 hypothetical protein [Nanoarchaeota archaeon]HIH59517.1 hypothetical protein [Nanoarchaeota archaeon]HII14120.1 hypothetical protein [Nanoarchaeota archaeon]
MVKYNLLGREVEEVYGSKLHTALASCDGAFFMPDLIRSRISVDDSHRLWQTWWSAPSIRATGRTSGGTPVVLYAHVPNFYSDANNIKTAVEERKLVNGAGVLPREEFTRLLSLEGNGVQVVDHTVLNKSPKGNISFSQALKHPQTLPFLGVSQEEAQAYLIKHTSLYGSHIGIWHSNDLGEEPVARVLFLDYGNVNGLNGNVNLINYGRVLGVRRCASISEPVSAGGTPQKISSSPSLEILLEKSKPYILPSYFEGYEAMLTDLYKKK